MSENESKKRRRHHWLYKKRWSPIFTILSTIASGIVGFLLGVFIDVCTTIRKDVSDISDNIKTISTDFKKVNKNICVYRDEVNSATKNITFNTDKGVKCSVGINKTNPIFFATVSSAYNPHNLKGDEKLLFICENKKDRSMYCVEAYVDIVDASPDSKAEFFLNTEMFHILGIPNPSGVYNMSFKKIPKN